MNNRTTEGRKLSKSTGLTALTSTPIKGEIMIKGTNMAEFRLPILAGFIAIILTFSACGDGGDGDGDSSSSNGGGVSSSSDGGTSSSSDDELSSSSSDELSSSSSDFTFDNVQCWITGASCVNTSCDSKAMMVVQWNDGKNPVALVWGYKFNDISKTTPTDSITGENMILDIMRQDPRFYLLGNEGLSTTYEGVTTYLGLAVGGIGYDPAKNLSLYRNTDDSTWATPNVLPRFFVPDSTYDYDDWECDSSNCTIVRWQSGWKRGNWWYDTTNAATFSSSWVGTSSRKLINGSRDAYYYVDTAFVMNPPPLSSIFTPVPPID
jgi:hypothetical protein